MKLRKEKIIVTTGSFDPPDSDDIEFLKAARKKGQWLIVGIHTDMYMMKNVGGFILNYDSRSTLMRNLKYVDEVFSYNDEDDTACQLLKIVQIIYPNSDIFYVCRDGDKDTLPEAKIRGIKFLTMK